MSPSATAARPARPSAQVSEALLGEHPGDLSGLIDSTRRRLLEARLARVRAQLDLITNFSMTTGALAAESNALEQTLAELAPTLEQAQPDLVAVQQDAAAAARLRARADAGRQGAAGDDHGRQPLAAADDPAAAAGRARPHQPPACGDTQPNLTSGHATLSTACCRSCSTTSRCVSKVLVPAGDIVIDDSSAPARRTTRTSSTRRPARTESAPTSTATGRCCARSRRRSAARLDTGPRRRQRSGYPLEHAALGLHDRVADRLPAAAALQRPADPDRCQVPVQRRAEPQRLRPARRSAPPRRRRRPRHEAGDRQILARLHRGDRPLGDRARDPVRDPLPAELRRCPRGSRSSVRTASSLEVEFQTAQAVTPGQGQSVNLAGVKIGDVTGVDLEDGVAVVSMEIDTKYAPLIHDDASALLRPRTGLQDMTVELDPGTVNSPQIQESAPDQPRLDEARSERRPDPRLARRRHPGLPATCCSPAAPRPSAATRGRSSQPSLRRIEPTTRDIAKINVRSPSAART